MFDPKVFHASLVCVAYQLLNHRQHNEGRKEFWKLKERFFHVPGFQELLENIEQSLGSSELLKGALQEALASLRQRGLSFGLREYELRIPTAGSSIEDVWKELLMHGIFPPDVELVNARNENAYVVFLVRFQR